MALRVGVGDGANLAKGQRRPDETGLKSAEHVDLEDDRAWRCHRVLHVGEPTRPLADVPEVVNQRLAGREILARREGDKKEERCAVRVPGSAEVVEDGPRTRQRLTVRQRVEDADALVEHVVPGRRPGRPLEIERGGLGLGGPQDVTVQHQGHGNIGHS